MNRSNVTPLRIGEWCVSPASGEISRSEETIRLDVRTMRLLLCLAERAGEVVSIDDLLNKVWPEVNVSPDSVYQAVASLRRQLGDDSRQPTYIETVPRLGYRMVAKVSPWESAATELVATEHPDSHRRHSIGFLLSIAVGIVLAFVIFFLLRIRAANNAHSSTVIAAQSQKSIAVLPFLDLTEGMKEEEFADGMTEELIDKLSKIPGLRVPAPTASFYFKNRRVPIADIARSLGVVYVLDGSVRKSGKRLRVAARLVRADSGYVIWSETYDRPFDDAVIVQDDIASEVTKKLSSSIDSTPPNPQ
jgi:TolB-like protein/DNA-binding winged helix-turn-helix (wHTH) protein